MNTNERDKSRCRADLLIETAIAGRATPNEHAELESLLAEFPEYREAYMSRSALHLDLRNLFTDPQLTPVVDVSSPQRFQKIPFLRVVAALVVMVLMLAFVVVRDRDGHQIADHGVAGSVASPPLRSPVVTATDNAEIFGEGFSPRLGQPLSLDKVYVLTHGEMTVEFPSGAKASLIAPCVFSPTGTESLLVRSGQCSVHAPPGAEGFVVTTPSADVVDLGTRFVVSVSEAGETDLLVVDGAAEFSAVDDRTGAKLVLTDGESARIEPDQAPQRGEELVSGLHYRESLRDRVIKYDATVDADGFADELRSVTVQRGGENKVYSRSQLTRGTLSQFSSNVDNAVCTTRQGEALPKGRERLGLLDADWSLVTGIINPRSPATDSGHDLTVPVLAVNFMPPVVNGPGPDVLVFDLQLLVYPKTGDALRVVSGDPGRTGLLEINQFDVDLASPYALDLVPHKTFKTRSRITGIEDLITGDFQHGRQTHVNAKALVTGIDLSDVGYLPGESMERLVFLETGDRYGIDPVLIVGLPELR